MDELPPLPRPFVPGDESSPRDFYVADQMQAYARQAVAQAVDVPAMTATRCLDLAAAAGFNMDPTPNMLYTVRGNAAQVINFARAIEAEVRAQHAAARGEWR